MPVISIIVPVYKVEAYIRKCIDSILAQSFTNFELILVNDGSPDNCGNICDTYAKIDKRIKVIHKENGGLSDARNAGIEIAEGEYIGFVDGDDYVGNKMYESLYSALIANAVSVSMCGRYNVFPEEKEELFVFEEQKVWSASEAISRVLIWDGIDSSVCDKLFHKSLFEKTRFPLDKYNEDVFIMIQLLDQAGKIVHVGEPFYFYLQRENSITSEAFSMKKLDLLEATQGVLVFVQENYPALIKKAEGFHYQGLIRLLLMMQEKQTKRHHKKTYKILKRQLMKEFKQIILNGYIEPKLKFLAILVLLELYNISMRLNRLKRAFIIL